MGWKNSSKPTARSPRQNIAGRRKYDRVGGSGLTKKFVAGTVVAINFLYLVVEAMVSQHC